MTGQRRTLSEAELHAFVDGELAPDEQAEIEEVLASHPSELLLARELRELNDAMRARYADRLVDPLPPAIKARLARFKRAGAGQLARRIVRQAAALVLVVGAAATGYLAHSLLTPSQTPEYAFAATAVRAHRVYVAEVRHPVEVKAEEEHLVRWLGKRVGADLRAPILADVGWRLMGGRLLPDQDSLYAAQFMYEDASGRRLTLYIRKETGTGNTAFRFFERDGYSAFYWIDQPLAYALAGPLSRDELMVLANTVYGQLEARTPAATPSQSP